MEAASLTGGLDKPAEALSVANRVPRRCGCEEVPGLPGSSGTRLTSRLRGGVDCAVQTSLRVPIRRIPSQPPRDQ